MGTDSPTSAQSIKFCQGDNHLSENKFECMSENCSIKPYLCKACAERSDIDNDKLICKLCKITEQMDTFDSSKLEVD